MPGLAVNTLLRKDSPNGDEMKNGPCPECNSTNVFYSKGQDGEVLQDEHSIDITVAGIADNEVDTYVCMNCGHIHLYLSPDNLADIVAHFGKNKLWKRVA
jgi:hypothetical protein